MGDCTSAELDAEDRKTLALTFANDLVARFGVGADVAVHAPHRNGDQRNHHAHILTTTRRIEADGFTIKTRELDDRRLGSQNIIDMREHWATLQNQALERAGSIERVDHRSLEAQREEAERERDQLQERVIELESVIDGYAMQLVEPGNLKRLGDMPSHEVNCEWHDVEQAERERQKLEMQVQAQTLRAAELDRAPQVKLGPSVSAMERKAQLQAQERGADYEPATERGDSVQEAQEQLSFVEDARERFDAARTAYSEARELGFSRARSAYEATREALCLASSRPLRKQISDRTPQRMSPCLKEHWREWKLASEIEIASNIEMFRTRQNTRHRGRRAFGMRWMASDASNHRRMKIQQRVMR